VRCGDTAATIERVITATIGVPFTATAASFPSGLAGTMTIDVYDPATNGEIIAPTTTGIAETAPGSYQATLTVEQLGAFTVRWQGGGFIAEEDLAVGTHLAGTYATAQDVRFALAPDGDTGTSTAASLSDVELNDAIGEAQGEVDARLPGDPYPTGQAPPIVSAITRDIAAYLATLTFRRGLALDPNDPVALRYKRATGLLADISAGRIDIDPATGAAVPAEVAIVNPYGGDLFGVDDFHLRDLPTVPPARPQPWPGY
jgi:phage gp36-like protein